MALYLPIAQSVHEPLPVALWALPAGQSEQLADLLAEYLPLAHTEQDFAPADEKVPAAHSLQMPAEWTYVPASHSPQSDEPLGEDSPASQALQDELPSSLE